MTKCTLLSSWRHPRRLAASMELRFTDDPARQTRECQGVGGHYLRAHRNRLAEHPQTGERDVRPPFPELSLPPNPTLILLSVPSTMSTRLERPECQSMSPPPPPPWD